MHPNNTNFAALFYPLKLVSQWVQDTRSKLRSIWYQVFPIVPRATDDPDDAEGRQW
jgi:hypothetical protein